MCPTRWCGALWWIERGEGVRTGSPFTLAFCDSCRCAPEHISRSQAKISGADLGEPGNWPIGPASRPVSGETSVARSRAPTGLRLRPFPVARVEQLWHSPRASGDLTIRWKRRSRSLAADILGAGEVPLAERAGAFEVEMRDGGTVKRRLTATTSSVFQCFKSEASPPRRMHPGRSGLFVSASTRWRTG